MKRVSRERLDVIVVGAGMVGAAAALALARADLRCAVIEDKPATSPAAGAEFDLRVVAIAPHSKALLTDLGVWQRLDPQRIAPYARMQVVDALGGAALEFDAAEYAWPHLGYIVENRAVAGALWQVLAAEPNIRLLAPDHLESFETQADGVRVTLASGGVLDAALLIGADGISSKVRNDLLIGVDGYAYPQNGLVAHVDLERAHDSIAWQRFLPSGPLAFLPLADGRASIVWTLPEERAQALLTASEADFESQLRRASADRFGRTRLSSSRALFPLRLQIAQRFAEGKVLLIGDAAHVVHPLAGQGVNIGFEDVTALIASVERARASHRPVLSTGDLARWARERRSEATLAARAFDALNRLYSVTDGPLIGARALGLNLVNRMPGIKRKFAERAAGIRAGWRA